MRRGNAPRRRDAPDRSPNQPESIADHDDVVSVRAEDASGSFGILPGHADLITVMTPSVVAWRHVDGRPGWCAVRRGVLSVRDGREVAIATRQAQLGNDLAALEDAVLARFRAELDAERRARVAATQAARSRHPSDRPRAASGWPPDAGRRHDTQASDRGQ